jgi:hypothetical protein
VTAEKGRSSPRPAGELRVSRSSAGPSECRNWEPGFQDERGAANFGTPARQPGRAVVDRRFRQECGNSHAGLHRQAAARTRGAGRWVSSSGEGRGRAAAAAPEAAEPGAGRGRARNRPGARGVATRTAHPIWLTVHRRSIDSKRSRFRDVPASLSIPLQGAAAPVERFPPRAAGARGGMRRGPTMGTIDIEPGAQVPFDAAGWHITALLRDCCTLLGRFVGRDLERGDRTGQFFVDRRAVAKLRETALRHAPCRNRCL